MRLSTSQKGFVPLPRIVAGMLSVGLMSRALLLAAAALLLTAAPVLAAENTNVGAVVMHGKWGSPLTVSWR